MSDQSSGPKHRERRPTNREVLAFASREGGGERTSPALETITKIEQALRERAEQAKPPRARLERKLKFIFSLSTEAVRLSEELLQELRDGKYGSLEDHEDIDSG